MESIAQLHLFFCFNCGFLHKKTSGRDETSCRETSKNIKYKTVSVTESRGETTQVEVKPAANNSVIKYSGTRGGTPSIPIKKTWTGCRTFGPLSSLSDSPASHDLQTGSVKSNAPPAPRLPNNDHHLPPVHKEDIFHNVSRRKARSSFQLL